MIPAGLVLPGILATIALFAWARGWRVVEFKGGPIVIRIPKTDEPPETITFYYDEEDKP